LSQVGQSGRFIEHRSTCRARSSHVQRRSLLQQARRADRQQRLAEQPPVRGTAPDIAGQDKANPLASILSAAMLLRHSFAAL
jgi:hypothetical protein